jgi:hypothetical protein
MTAYIGIREDAFGAALTSMTTDARRRASIADQARVAAPNIRRPFHGMTLHDDTYSTITVATASGAMPHALYDSSSADPDSLEGSSTSNLIIQSIVERREEKQQIVQTFGEDFVYFFGERRMVTFTAILPESPEFQYAQEFWWNYEKVLRGTRSVLRGLRTYLSVDRQIFEGYIVNASTQRQADNPRIVNLDFTMYVTRSQYVDKLRNQPVGLKKNTTYLKHRKGDFVLTDLYEGGEKAQPELSQLTNLVYYAVGLPVRYADIDDADLTGKPIRAVATDDLRVPTKKPSGLSNALSGVGAAISTTLTIAGTALLTLGVARSLIDEITGYEGGLVQMGLDALGNTFDPGGANSDLLRKGAGDAVAISGAIGLTANENIRKVATSPNTPTDTLLLDAPATTSTSADDVVLDL